MLAGDAPTVCGRQVFWRAPSNTSEGVIFHLCYEHGPKVMLRGLLSKHTMAVDNKDGGKWISCLIYYQKGTRCGAKEQLDS